MNCKFSKDGMCYYTHQPDNQSFPEILCDGDDTDKLGCPVWMKGAQVVA